MSKKLINLLRHGSLPRDSDGAIEFWRIKDYLQDHFVFVIIGLTKSGKPARQEEEETRKNIQYCTDSSGAILYLRALQGHSGRNIIDPSFQDNVIVQNNFFQYMYHVSCRMCVQFTFHHQFGINTGRTKFEQQTVSILSACGSHGQGALGS